MEELHKTIKVNDDRSIIYDIRNVYVQTHTIVDKDAKNIRKVLTLSRWDDYGFKSWQDIDYDEYDKTTRLIHVFDKEHPLFVPLFNLLNGNKELIIDDDATSELNKKYMRIYLEDYKIIIEFVNKLNKVADIEKFNIFIKNIGFDLRSKIDCLELDTKERLFFFFKEVYESLIDEYHQMTIEEYLAINNKLTLEESKKYTRKINI